jgi:hypothetical protein
MRAEPKTILRFLLEYFDCIRDLFDAQTKDGTIRKEVLKLACETHGSDIQPQLLEYKILKQLNDDFEFRPVYYSFLEYLLNEFKPLLPETIEKYLGSINELFRKIKEGINGNKQILGNRIDDLSLEIREFLEAVEKNTVRLLSETRTLKSNVEKIDYSEKVQKASFWIEYYIVPLNKILDINHSESVANKLYDISEFANQKRLIFDDESLRLKFEKLYHQLLQTNDDLLRQSKVLTNELLPLIERIRTESAILTGWIEFLRNPYKIEVPPMLKTNRDNPYSPTMMLSTREFFEQFMEEEDMYLDGGAVNQEKWVFDKEHYKEKLTASLPMASFFDWCRNTLQADYQQMDSDKFFSLVGLLFEEDLALEFTDQEEYEYIELNDYTVKVPKVTVNYGVS